MKVKICGIKNFDEAMRTIEAGADMLGFNFYPRSPRYITPGACLRLITRLQTALREQFAQVSTVGVFVDAEPDLIISILMDCPLDVAQLSGDEPPEVLETLNDRAYKALRPPSIEAMEAGIQRFPSRRIQPPFWLLDAYQPGKYGGTGQAVDWRMAARLAERAPILLAGGLRAGNVAEAIRQVRPWGIDVASGVESSPGVKDARLVREFIGIVRSCEKELA